MALTDTAIRNAKPREKPYKLADGGGLFLQVYPGGGKLWRQKYRVDGREKKLSLGAYPEISLAEARRRRESAREQMAMGRDPSREKADGQAAGAGAQCLHLLRGLRRILPASQAGWS